MTAVAVVVALVVVALAPATAAALWWRAAERARRELLDALAVVPEVASVIAPGDADRRARTAALVAEGMGLDAEATGHVGRAARLAGLVGLVPDVDDDVWAAARAVDRVTTESEVPGPTAAILADTVTAHRGRAGRPAAAVRVAATYHAACASDGSTTSGALFTTVATHGSGHERRAAAALVRLVQGDVPSA